MSPSLRLNLECLDDRLVPSTVYLTTKGAEGTTSTGAIVQQVDPQPMGSGYVHAFVRIQGSASGGGSEQGYNTDGRPLQFDENKSPQFTRSLTLGQVPVVNVNGTAYREFLLDINQKSSSPLLSLDEVRIFLGSTGNLTGYDTTANTLAGQSPVFDLNPDGSNEVILDARLSSGLGSGDMALFVPNSAFAGGSAGSYVYLYSQMGGLAGYTANGGFEQWSVASTPPAQSPPVVGSISGAVLLYGTTTGISGVQITLIGTDSAGNTVNLQTYTDANGNFTFGNLAAGTYTIIQTPPPLLTTVAETLGTVNGSADGTENVLLNEFTGVALGAGQNGTNYIFSDSNNG
jgi:hypothetical protein